MAKNKVSEWSSTPANNTDVGGIDIAEGCAPSGINNGIREIMSQIKDMQAGLDGDNFTVGGNLSVTGTSTFSGLVTLSTLATTGNTTIGDSSGDVLTITGSAITIPNGLNFDSNTFVIDATNNRVGIAKSSPTTALDVNGTVTATALVGPLTGNVTGNLTGNADTVTNGVYTSGSYSNPSWITALANTKITGLGTMSTQNANNVTISGGAITSTTINTFTVGANSVGARTIQSTSSGVPTGGSSGDIVYQY